MNADQKALENVDAIEKNQKVNLFEKSMITLNSVLNTVTLGGLAFLGKMSYDLFKKDSKVALKFPNFSEFTKMSKEYAVKNPKTTAAIAAGTIAYGVLDLATGYQVYATQKIKDSRIGKAVRELNDAGDQLSPETKSIVEKTVLGKWTKAATTSPAAEETEVAR